MYTDKFLEITGGKVFVRHWNAFVTKAVPLFLLHDSLGCVELWRDFPAALAERLQRPVIAYDRPGFGRSSARDRLPASDFIREEAEVIFPAVRAALGVKEFAVMGHSVGGGMALTIAALEGNSCLAVISESAQAFVEDRTITGIKQAQAIFKQPEQFERLRKWHGDKAQWVLDAWTKTWLSPEFATWSLAPVLPHVHCPALIIHGDADEYGSDAFPRFIRDHVAGPAAMHILDGCGHVPHRERAGEVIELIAKFLIPSEARS
jgi:pimeloyl-ACP methyl ester carboxylesterase